MRLIVVAAGFALAASAVALGAGGGAAEARASRGGAEAAGDRLGERIEAAIKAEGPFFTPEEQAVIARKCGYAPGSWDGFEVNISNGVLTCRGGKRVDDAEMRALLAVAEPRIERRVEAVMESAEVRAAIKAVAEEAERAALASIDHALIAREASREAEKAMREAARAMEKAGRR